MRLCALWSLLVLLNGVNADKSGSSLYPPGLLPQINHANSLLSSGKYIDAAKAYSEAIEQSPSDYLLYYKRATAYFSLNRHSSALEDFEKVLHLTSSTFDNAFLMKAKIHTKDGHFSDAREALKRYTAKVQGDQVATDLMFAISEAEAASDKANRAAKAQLWTACVDFASKGLMTSSFSVRLRQLRVECALAAGEIESAVGDLTRLMNITPSSTTSLMRIYRLAYFFLKPSTPPSSSPAVSALKQCLHLDPDSKHCLAAHRFVKSSDKLFSKIESALQTKDWHGVIALVLGRSPNKLLGDGLLQKFQVAMEEFALPELLAVESPSRAEFPMPSAEKSSYRRQILLSAVCRAYTHIGTSRSGERWCDALLAMDGNREDVDGLTGKGDAALQREEWEEAVRYLERAFEASGRSDSEVHERLQRAKRLLKQSKQKDYYKVLGVARDADARTIKKAFRRAAMKAHPDKGGSEAKMATVNEAYEVLSKPELRARFDSGEDPNDPMASQHGHPFTGDFNGGHPFFANFFQQSGGQGFHFHHSHH